MSSVVEGMTSGGIATPIQTTADGKVVVSGASGAVPAATGTQTTVNSSATAVTLLASNASRKGVSIANNSTAILYVILSGTTPTSTVYTVAMVGNANGVAYYEAPYGYTGIVQGIWASANGSASVVEYT